MITENSSGQNLGGFHHFEFWNPLAQLHIHIYHIPKFQNNLSSVYWELKQTKFGKKEKEVEEETEQKHCLPISFGELNLGVKGLVQV